MNSSNYYIIMFFFVGLVLILYFLLISIFGYFFLYNLRKHINEKENKCLFSSLDQIFISFGVGLSVYMSLSYLLDLFASFNFYTAYLSIIIFDVGFLFYYIHIKKEVQIKVDFKKIFNIVVKKLSSKNNLCFTLCFAITISILLIIQWIIITEATSLIYTDPFKWYQSIFYLIDNGHLDHQNSDYNYPLGFTFFNAGILLIYPDYLFGYYYLKLVPLYLIVLYIIIVSKIIKQLFKENYLYFLSFLLILISNYFLSRTLLYIPSSLATILVIISILVIINKYSNYLLAVLMVGLYLTHALTAFYFIFAVLGFYMYKFIFSEKSSKKFLNQLYSTLLFLLIIFSLLVPYFITIYYIYGDNIYDFLDYFFMRFEDQDYIFISKNVIGNNKLLFKLIFPLQFFETSIDENLLDLLNELFENSIFLLFFYPVFGLFVYINPHNKLKNSEILIFFKIFIILILFFFFLPYLIPTLNFFIKFRKRILQSFNLPIIIMSLYFVEWLINKSRMITCFLIQKLSFYRLLLQKNKFYTRIFRIESLLFIILSASASSIFIMHKFPDYHYYYDDNLVEIVLYLRTHAKDNSKILREDFDSAVIFRILYDMKIEIWDLNRSSSYQDLLFEIDDKKIDYLIFSKGFFDNKTVEDSLCKNSKFKDILDNDDFILFRIEF